MTPKNSKKTYGEIRFLPSVSQWIIVLTVFLLFSSTDQFQKAREHMVSNDIQKRGISDQRVLDAMRKIPRHLFVRRDLQKSAYDDNPLPIGEGQTISQPYIVALMTQALGIKSSDRILEIGTGSGYQAAVLAELASEVYSIEIKKSLAKKAEYLIQRLGYRNIKIKHGDGYIGWKKHAQFDAIIITAASPYIPPPIINQLKIGGRLILPQGNPTTAQQLILYEKREDRLEKEVLSLVRFVPLTGKISEK